MKRLEPQSERAVSIKSKRGLVRTKDGKLELEHWGAEKRDVHTNKYIYQELFREFIRD